jgi:hypothetical protein
LVLKSINNLIIRLFKDAAKLSEEEISKILFKDEEPDTQP